VQSASQDIPHGNGLNARLRFEVIKVRGFLRYPTSISPPI
jgi:hypothetical protein